MPYNEDLCKKVQENFKETLKTHETRLNNHGDRLDVLEQDGRDAKVQIVNLIKSIDGLVSTMKWLIGLLVPTIVAIVGLLLKG